MPRAKELVRIQHVAPHGVVFTRRLMSDGLEETRNTLLGRTTPWMAFERHVSADRAQFVARYALSGYTEIAPR